MSSGSPTSYSFLTHSLRLPPLLPTKTVSGMAIDGFLVSNSSGYSSPSSSQSRGHSPTALLCVLKTVLGLYNAGLLAPALLAALSSLLYLEVPQASALGHCLLNLSTVPSAVHDCWLGCVVGWSLGSLATYHLCSWQGHLQSDVLPRHVPAFPPRPWHLSPIVSHTRPSPLLPACSYPYALHLTRWSLHSAV